MVGSVVVGHGARARAARAFFETAGPAEKRIRSSAKHIYSSTPSQTQPLTQTLDDPCSICLEPMQRSELVLALQCGHLYHASCVRAWLGRRQWCPLCKAPAL